jgi:hypothetical protein
MVHFQKYATYCPINRMETGVYIVLSTNKNPTKISLTVTIKMHVTGIKLETAIPKITLFQVRLYLNYMTYNKLHGI